MSIKAHDDAPHNTSNENAASEQQPKLDGPRVNGHDALDTLGAALRLAERGYHCVPLPPRKQNAVIDDWPELRIKPSEIERYFKRGDNLGLLMGTEIEPGVFLIAFDTDVDDQELIDRVRCAIGSGFPEKFGSKGGTCIGRTASSIKGVKLRRKNPLTGKPETLIEVLGKGSQTVVPPSIHPKTGQPYRWLTTPLDEIEPGDLPEITAEVLDEIRLAVEKPQSPLFAINEMRYCGKDEGGDVHNSVL
jgi:hypothetical protein